MHNKDLNMKKFVCIILLVLVIAPLSQAQVKNGIYSNLEKMFVKEQWEDLAFKTERMILQDKYKNNAEVYLYLSYSYAKIFLMCLEDQKLLDKVPEYVNSYNNALKYSVIAKKKDKKDKIYFPENDNLLEEIAVIGIYYVDHYIGVKKYSKANSRVRKMLKTYSDDNLVAMHGLLASIVGDTVTATPIIDKLFANADKRHKERNTDFILLDAFDMYADYLLTRETPKVDEAIKYLNLGLKYFPSDPILLYDIEVAKNPEYAEMKNKPTNYRKEKMLNEVAVFSDDDESEDDEEEDL